MSDTATAVRRVIAEETGRELHELALDTDLRRDLGLCDDAVLGLVIEVESELDVVFDADEPGTVDTVGRLIRLAERQADRFTRRRREPR